LLIEIVGIGVGSLVSTRARYGLQALFHLALRSPARPVPLKAIAQEAGLPVPYLEQLMAPLRKAGIVRSLRGPQGGYALAREPEQVSVWEVVACLEGEPRMAQCPCPDPARDDRCLDALLWRDLDRTLEEAMRRVTLRDLVLRAEKARPLYYI
jgi:Rrf2 family cysteine metabolism transcriptional repressor